MKFFNDGAVNFPYLSDGMWFLTQHKRWGLLKEHPDYLAVAKQINQIELYKQAAGALKISVPKDPMRTQQADRRRGLGRQGPARSTPTSFAHQGLNRRGPSWSAPSSIRRSAASARAAPPRPSARAAKPTPVCGRRRRASRRHRAKPPSTGARLWLKVLPPIDRHRAC